MAEEGGTGLSESMQTVPKVLALIGNECLHRTGFGAAESSTLSPFRKLGLSEQAIVRKCVLQP
jgi:hypothetical protein